MTTKTEYLANIFVFVYPRKKSNELLDVCYHDALLTRTFNCVDSIKGFVIPMTCKFFIQSFQKRVTNISDGKPTGHLISRIDTHHFPVLNRGDDSIAGGVRNGLDDYARNQSFYRFGAGLMIHLRNIAKENIVSNGELSRATHRSFGDFLFNSYTEQMMTGHLFDVTADAGATFYNGYVSSYYDLFPMTDEETDNDDESDDEDVDL